jgi:hypothetical protein
MTFHPSLEYWEESEVAWSERSRKYVGWGMLGIWFFQN